MYGDDDEEEDGWFSFRSSPLSYDPEGGIWTCRCRVYAMRQRCFHVMYRPVTIIRPLARYL